MVTQQQALSLGLLYLPTVAPWAKASDRQALRDLYEAAGGETWGPNLDYWTPMKGNLDPLWNETSGNKFWNTITNANDPTYLADPCQDKLNSDGELPDWYGVGCQDPCYVPIDGFDCQFGRITSIILPANNLEGTIPESLFDKLVNLSVVDFSHNKLSGTIPTTIGKLRNIATFLLGNNKLSGTIPTEVQTMGTHIGPGEEACDLEDLRWPSGELYFPNGVPEGGVNISAEEALAFNGTCPTHETKTMGLAEFDVSANSLVGMLPTTFGDLINLEAIDVSRNEDLGMEGYAPPDAADDLHAQHYVYTSMVPTEMGYLKKLREIKMDNSRFMRHMPTELGNMRSLTFWDVQGTTTPGEPETNAVSGTIPTEFGRLKKLETFMMENNTVSGTIPVDLANMTSLWRFSVPDNKLSGSIPDIFGGLKINLELWDTFNNKLTGDMPSSIGETLALEYLYVQNEQTDPLRNFFCRERIENSAVGRKANYAMMAHDYISMSMAGTCINPFDVEGAFGQLSGDV